MPEISSVTVSVYLETQEGKCHDWNDVKDLGDAS